ncbi:DUF2786 domain-containing protein [Nonomuraea cavernae]|uniref:DUF2786 domain-containing protein n=1 Tax=Nonomuraea cavernae TaxID=2045107 RepID=A0A917Z4C2_9ACTN|nr:DUF2786 domain-containing protein [Nonomuraea cavernae]MCA2188036.1 DUF2786 domain-containing protein [Nonomuraea cavernae]GGO72619.1 hypothetical protein GCM10012289_41040 [Nonomuraea cavernae]
MRERTLERVRKLLAKAERTDNEHERATFMAAASALMAKHGIDTLAPGPGPGSGRRVPGDRIVTLSAPWAREKARLVSLVAQAVRCRPLLIGASAADCGGQRVHVFGFAADLERADVLATSLLLQMASGLAGVRPPRDAVSARAYRRSWLLGFADEVYRLLCEAERRAEAEAPAAGTALVLADRRAEVERAVAARYPRVRMSVPRTSGTGYRDGAAAGRRADLGRPRMGGRVAALSWEPC